MTVVLAADRVTVHGAVPMQPPPDQPLNVELADSVPVSVTVGFAVVRV